MDSFGHVNNAVFLNYLEAARCEFLLQHDLRFNDFFRWDKFPVVTKVNLDYKAPALADDILLIKGWLKQHSAASFTLEYQITREEDQRLILKGETYHVFIDGNQKPTRVPREFFDKFIQPNI